jgi:hypothetical protein
MEENIKESGKRVIMMVKDIRSHQKEMNIWESTRITKNRERVSKMRMENYTK